MNIQIINKPFQLSVSGISTIAFDKDYAGAAFKASGIMWDIVKTNGLKNKGRNIWVYEEGDSVFAGIELEDASDLNNVGLDRKEIILEKYAYYKHIGPYALIKKAGQEMSAQIAKQGFEVSLPYIEIYGHWNKDESKLETELFMALK